MELHHKKVSYHSPKHLDKLKRMITNNPEKIKFNAYFPAELHRDFKVFAAEKGMKMTDIIVNLVFKHIYKD